jgi:peptidoglycan/LPS O-acetylase OafA/YrhL/acetyltransferase-like isoleucine patch superfamily enzyme
MTEQSRDRSGSRPSEPFVLVGHRLPALDGLRGLAILVVLVYHFADQFQTRAACYADSVFLRVCQSGWIGVELFFVLSGFLITGILMDTRRCAAYFRSFYGRRVLRIFPAYFVTLAALFVLIPLCSSRLPGGFRDMLGRMAEHQAWFWSYLANWLFAWNGEFGSVPGGYLWSLAVEEQFYLVWPLVVFWLNRDALARWIVCLLSASIVLRLGLLACGVSATSVYAATITHLDGLLAGALVAVVVRKSRLDLLPWRRLGIVAGLSCLVLIGIGTYHGHFRFWDAPIAGVGLSLLAVCFAFLLLAAIAADEGSLIHRRLSNRILQSFGRYSYAIYLLHVPIGLALEKLVFLSHRYSWGGEITLPVVLFMVLAVGICWLAGFASWHLFEKHFLKLKVHFSYGTSLPTPHMQDQRPVKAQGRPSLNLSTVRRVAKRGAIIIAAVVVMPLIAVTKLEQRVSRSESWFATCGTALGLIPGKIGDYLRLGFYRFTLQKCSCDACISFGVLVSHRTAEFGRHVSIGAYSIIGTVTLGDHVLIGSRVSITSGRNQHDVADLSKNITDENTTFERVHIGSNTWIGEGAIIMADVGSRCVIGAGSVVPRAIPDGTTAVGNPARPPARRRAESSDHAETDAVLAWTDARAYRVADRPSQGVRATAAGSADSLNVAEEETTPVSPVSFLASGVTQECGAAHVG